MTTKISADNLKADIAITTTGDIDVSSGTLTLANDQISGDKISGGTISTFASTGIDDNATSTAVTIDSSERVGIGTASPQTQLHINAGTANDVLRLVSTDADANLLIGDSGGSVKLSQTSGTIKFETGGISSFGAFTEAMRIDSSGNVGIGTSSPDNLLHIEGDQPTYKLTSTNPLSTSVGTETIADIDFEAQNNNIYRTTARIRARQDGTWSAATSNFAPTALDFFTQDNSTSDAMTSPRMTINEDGNVGIRTSSPVSQLHIYSPSGTTGFRITRGADITGVGMNLACDSASNNILSYGDLRFRVSPTGTGTGASERMRIDTSGNVGIGTSSPLRELDVSSATAEIAINSTGSSYSRVNHYHNGTNIWTTGTRAASDFHIYRESGSGNVIVDNGNVGIGTSSPSSKLEVLGDITAPKTSTNSQTRTLLLGGARNGGNNAFANIDFQQYDDSGTSTDFIGGRISAREYGPDDTALSFYTANNTTLSEAMRIDDNGDLTVYNGIYLGGTGTANKLDDYEEGTWTPTAINTGSWSGFVHTNMNVYMAQYTKVGRKVSIMAGITFPDSSTTIALAAGDHIQLSGLPFSIGGSGTDDVYGAISPQVFIRDSTNGGIAHANISYLDQIQIRVVATYGDGRRSQQGLRLSCTYFTD